MPSPQQYFPQYYKTGPTGAEYFAQGFSQSFQAFMQKWMRDKERMEELRVQLGTMDPEDVNNILRVMDPKMRDKLIKSGFQLPQETPQMKLKKETEKLQQTELKQRLAKFPFEMDLVNAQIQEAQLALKQRQQLQAFADKDPSNALLVGLANGMDLDRASAMHIASKWPDLATEAVMKRFDVGKPAEDARFKEALQWSVEQFGAPDPVLARAIAKNDIEALMKLPPNKLSLGAQRITMDRQQLLQSKAEMALRERTTIADLTSGFMTQYQLPQEVALRTATALVKGQPISTEDAKLVGGAQDLISTMQFQKSYLDMKSMLTQPGAMEEMKELTQDISRMIDSQGKALADPQTMQRMQLALSDAVKRFNAERGIATPPQSPGFMGSLKAAWEAVAGTIVGVAKAAPPLLQDLRSEGGEGPPPSIHPKKSEGKKIVDAGAGTIKGVYQGVNQFLGLEPPPSPPKDTTPPTQKRLTAEEEYTLNLLVERTGDRIKSALAVPSSAPRDRIVAELKLILDQLEKAVKSKDPAEYLKAIEIIQKSGF